jgi:hypothetical protein
MNRIYPPALPFKELKRSRYGMATKLGREITPLCMVNPYKQITRCFPCPPIPKGAKPCSALKGAFIRRTEPSINAPRMEREIRSERSPKGGFCAGGGERYPLCADRAREPTKGIRCPLRPLQFQQGTKGTRPTRSVVPA